MGNFIITVPTDALAPLANTVPHYKGLTYNCASYHDFFKIPFIKSMKSFKLGNESSRNLVALLVLTHWGWEMHICVSKLAIIDSDNGLSPGQRQVIIWTNAGILLIGPLGTNFNETSIEIHIFSFKKIHLKLSSGKWRPFCLGLNVLRSPDTGNFIFCMTWAPSRCTQYSQAHWPKAKTRHHSIKYSVVPSIFSKICTK